MSRGAKRDKQTTALLRENRILFDRRSFVGIDWQYVPHLYLKGTDVTTMRERVWKKAQYKCEKCGCQVEWQTFEMDHIQGGLSGRCDCLHNLQALCHDCHAKKHVQVQWTRKAEAHKEFAKLYEETT